MRLGKPGQRFFVLDYETTGIDTEKDEPIEVGIIVTDENFNLVETFDSLIRPADPKWVDGQLYAYRVHGIHPSEFEEAMDPDDVGHYIADLAAQHTKNGSRPVLVSDNIQFEWAFTRRLLAAAKADWSFHYCGWDSSLLLEATGVGDPKPVHRALADAGLLHAAILRALERLRR